MMGKCKQVYRIHCLSAITLSVSCHQFCFSNYVLWHMKKTGRVDWNRVMILNKNFTDLHSSQFECSKHIIFLKSGFLQIIISLTCLLNNSSLMSRTPLSFLDSSRRFVSNSATLRFLQNWSHTVAPGDSLLSSFPVHSSTCSCSTYSYTGAVSMQSRRQHNSSVVRFCMTLSAHCVRLVMARRDRRWDTIL